MALVDSSGAPNQSFLIPASLPIPSWDGQALSPPAWATSGVTSGEAAAGRPVGRGPPSGITHPVLRAQRQGQGGSWSPRGLAEALPAAPWPQDILCYLWASGQSVFFVDEPSAGTASGPQPPSWFPASLLHRGSSALSSSLFRLASLKSPWAEGRGPSAGWRRNTLALPRH